MDIKSLNDINIESWTKKLTVPSILINSEETSKAMVNFKDYVLTLKGVKPVIKADDKHNRLLLKEGCNIEALRIGLNTDSEVTPYTVSIEPKARNYQEILREVLPEEELVPGSFEVFGDIAIIYLKTRQLEHKYVIGKAILITHPKLKAVLNKTDKLDNIFRNPVLELIAGEDKRETEIKEESVRMRLDVGEVYFCTRLMSERARVISSLNSGEVIVDIFCGIGPFALRAAKEKDCLVYANDLNPACYKYVNINAKLNKVESNIVPFNMDGRQFIKQIGDMVAKGEIREIDHVYMNLPALSIEFLDAFRTFDFSLLPKVPIFHLYCFEELEEEEHMINAKVEKRILESLDTTADKVDFMDFHSVKNVSLKKAYLCATFRYLYDGKKPSHEDYNSSEKNKKVKSSDN